MSFSTKLLWQNDPRWANTVLGYGPQTFQQWGCLATALTMVLNGSGYNETPVTVSQKMKAIGAFNGAAINAFRIGEAFPSVALANLVDCSNVPAPLAAIDAELSANKPVLVCVDQSPAPGIQDHWVLLYAKGGSDYLMLDPWDYSGDAQGKANYLTQRYKNEGGTPEKEITQVIYFKFSGTGSALSAPSSTPAPVPAPIPASIQPLPADAVSLTPSIDGLAFRAAPSVTGPLLRRFSLGTTLKSLEPRAATLQKIGVDGQWINIQAPEGDQGYVAAWYVSSVSTLGQAAPTPAPTATTPPAGTPTVTVISDQLAFRSQPVIDDSNLIERIALGTQLTVLDPQASQKIGVVGQWLMVKDASGHTGYVAAWYVK
jgi:hypothetical protein